jgi:S-formylglutathione hydrolase FrmB
MFHSAALGVDKHVLVYLPAGYAADPAKRWPVFYYLHGLGGNETNWIQLGKLDAAADAIHLGAIVVMPDGDDKFYIDSPTPTDYDACMRDGKGLLSPREPRAETCVHTNQYETYITHDLVDWVDSNYRTIATRDGRAVAGLSMGGFGALVLGFRRPEMFSAIASHSGVATWFLKGPRPYVSGKAELISDVTNWGDDIGAMGTWIRNLFGPDIAFWRDHDAATLVPKLEPGKLAIYLDCGTEDDLGLDLGTTYLHDLLAQRKIDHAYYEGPGHHNFDFWSARVGKSLEFLRDHTTAAR